MKNTVTKAKRKPRPPGTMAKAWETRRRNQALKAKPSDPLVLDRDAFLGAPSSEGQRASAKMYRDEVASAMNEALYGDPQPGSFMERYKIVSRYKEYLENLGFTVTYDPF